MSLDLTALGHQVRQMSNSLAHHANAIADRITTLRDAYLAQSGNERVVEQMVATSLSTATWLLARPMALPHTEPLNTIRDVPPRPPSYVLVATDGSQIGIDHHGIATCYLINIGQVWLRYGDPPGARLSSRPTLYYRDEDLFFNDGAKRIPIEGNYLNARRDVQELLSLTDLAEEMFDGSNPEVALQDGTLIRWTLAGAENVVQDRLLAPYLTSLEYLRVHHIPTASYISRPRTTDVVGLIRLLCCPDIDVQEQRGARCSQCSDVLAKRPPSCAPCNGLVDADIFAQHLAEGQRSPLFISTSRINIETYHHHLIHFFYMRVGREIVRIEVPQWVAHTPEQVDLIHAVVYNQCVKGQGYPVALARAHEQAVVRGADRHVFQRMIRESFVRANLPSTPSQKQESKDVCRL
jgi:hypothetical protein